MSHFLFLNASTRAPGQVGNTETLARRAAEALPADAKQTWLALAGLDLPAFVDHRHTTGVYPMPEGDAKQVLDALLSATDVVFVSPVYWFSVPSPLKLCLDQLLRGQRFTKPMLDRHGLFALRVCTRHRPLMFLNGSYPILRIRTSDPLPSFDVGCGSTAVS